MSREKIQFPTAAAYEQGLALLGGAVPVYVRHEKRRIIAAGEIPARLRSGLAELGATVSDDSRYDAEVDRA